MTEGFGRRWKDFFYDLEIHHGLNTDDPSHIWLLHWLYLPTINEEATAWANTWNSHKIQLDGERRSSPHQLYLWSCLTDGIRGLPPKASEPEASSVGGEGSEGGETHDEDPMDYSTYGVDWEAMDDPRLMEHHHQNNPQDGEDVLHTQHPAWINEVVCEPPDRPLTDDQFERLEENLARVISHGSSDMDVNRFIWATALDLFRRLHAE